MADRPRDAVRLNRAVMQGIESFAHGRDAATLTFAAVLVALALAGLIQLLF